MFLFIKIILECFFLGLLTCFIMSLFGIDPNNHILLGMIITYILHCTMKAVVSAEYI
jgi:hypothetical protein